MKMQACMVRIFQSIIRDFGGNVSDNDEKIPTASLSAAIAKLEQRARSTR